MITTKNILCTFQDLSMKFVKKFAKAI
ncbi:UNVERIFIED_CONTAM: hypothetical protein GTU68_013097 [Idotea baltica]|nr:hypothetical protein [Idotea baltica]